MKINIVRLADNKSPKYLNPIQREALDTTLLLHIEFVLGGEEHCIAVREIGDTLHITCPHGRLRILPETANAISVEVVK